MRAEKLSWQDLTVLVPVPTQRGSRGGMLGELSLGEHTAGSWQLPGDGSRQLLQLEAPQGAAVGRVPGPWRMCGWGAGCGESGTEGTDGMGRLVEAPTEERGRMEQREGGG